MKRRLAMRVTLLAGPCVLLGAVTTVAVAWGLVWRQHQPLLRSGWENSRLVGSDAHGAGWPAPVPADWPLPEYIDIRAAFGALEVTGYLLSDEIVYDGDSRHHVCARNEYGWPVGALRSEWNDALPLSSAPWRPGEWAFMSWRAGLWTRSDVGFGSVGVHYPCWPIATGLAADTAIYAGAWSLLLYAILRLTRLARRRFRVSRGMCGACGYDLKGLGGGVCPECGNGAGATA